ncbi:MAG: hypothetical protein RR202_02625 [Bacteroidales bacterium]
MKRILQIISLFMVLTITIETIGFNMVRYCCGESEFASVISLIEEESKETACLEECCSHEHQPLHEAQLYSRDGFHSHAGMRAWHPIHTTHHHHHDQTCISTSFVHLSPDNTLSFLSSLLPVAEEFVIQLFDIAPPVPTEEKITHLSELVPLSFGRTLLVRHSLLLI